LQPLLFYSLPPKNEFIIKYLNFLTSIYNHGDRAAHLLAGRAFAVVTFRTLPPQTLWLLTACVIPPHFFLPYKKMAKLLFAFQAILLVAAAAQLAGAEGGAKRRRGRVMDQSPPLRCPRGASALEADSLGQFHPTGNSTR
jgi:hypothetical protein